MYDHDNDKHSCNTPLLHQLFRARQHTCKRPALVPVHTVLEVKYTPDLVACAQDLVDVVLGVRRADAEAHATLEQWCRRVRNDDNDDRRSPLLHHPVQHRHLPQVVNEQRDDRRVDVAIGDEAEPVQAGVQVARVERQATKTGAALGAIGQGRREGDPAREKTGRGRAWVREWTDPVHDLSFRGHGGMRLYGREWRRHAHDAGHGGHDLHEDSRRHGLGVRTCRRPQPDTVDNVLRASDVATRSAKGLGERAHEDIHPPRVDAVVVANPATLGAERADGVGLVHEEVELDMISLRSTSA
jgi:hypothetical protein